jgi:protein involved in ribonucleotide reduction
MSLDIIFFSNRSNNTARFVKKIEVYDSYRIPIVWDSENPMLHSNPYVLFVPTYGSGNDGYSIPRPVASFLNMPSNRKLLRAVVGFGNTNFGSHYCKAAYMISERTGVPILGKVELFGTADDVNKIQEGLRKLNEQLQLP